MKELYIYNEDSGELFCSQKYDGGEIPSNGTLEIPPECGENETVVFNDGWKIVKDYRFTHKIHHRKHRGVRRNPGRVETDYE